VRARRGGAGAGVLEPVGTYRTEITARIVISCQLRCVELPRAAPPQDMNPDTAEMASVDATGEPASPFERPLPAPRLPAAGVSPHPAGDPAPSFGAAPRSRRRARRSRESGARGLRSAYGLRRIDLSAVDPAKLLAAREAWRALWSSRLLVWAAGTGTVLAFGAGPVRHAFNPSGVTRGLGWLGNLLAAPAARWDAAWYLVIAHYGYRPDLGAFTSSRTAFFPLYPLGVGAISRLGVPPIAAGVLLSSGALALALYGIHRLTTLELARTRTVTAAREGTVTTGRAIDRATDRLRDAEVARLAVLLTAFAPMAFFFSAVYSESLYLALSVGVFLCARQGRWAWVAVLGALAAMLYLYGPREDLSPDFPRAEKPRGAGRTSAATAERRGPGLAGASFVVQAAMVHAVARLRPNYRLRKDFLWLALVPAGLGIYMAYLALNGGEALMPFHAQDVWGRHFAGPYGGVWDGAKAAFEGARQLLSQGRHVYFPAAAGSPEIDAGHNLMLLAFLLVAVPMLVGVLRMLPLAYGVYAIAALALPLSYPVASQPLMSLPRFLVVLFPLSIWLAAWLAAHPRARTPTLVVSGLLMAFFVAQFATWHWVA
jgi:hypothetical protein